jgi:hypothetical protein
MRVDLKNSHLFERVVRCVVNELENGLLVDESASTRVVGLFCHDISYQVLN